MSQNPFFVGGPVPPEYFVGRGSEVRTAFMTAATALPDNPYVIGRPIYEPEHFFGREDLFQFIQDNLLQDAKVILLHGQRRIGKSSVLFQIPNFVKLEQFVFVPLSLEGKSQKPLSDVLHELAVDIKEHLTDNLNLPEDNVISPSKIDLKANLQVFDRNFLPQVYKALGGKNLVLLLDEFDVLDDHSKDAAVEHFFPYLQSILYQQKKLFIIPVVGRRLEDMTTLVRGLFRGAPKQEIGLLEEQNAKRLIIEPAKGVLEFNPDVIQAILELSAGHPYLTQVLCFALFSQARDEQRWQVIRADVESIVDKAIEIAEAGLVWFRDGLPIPERVVFSAVAEAQRIDASRGKLVTGEPLTLLKEYGVVQTDQLSQAGQQLVEWGFLDFAEDSGLPLVKVPKYRVKVELVRRWLVKRYPLRREIWELENLNSEAHYLYETAVNLRQYNNLLMDVLDIYERVLVRNPNYFSGLFDLAEGYLNVKNFRKAVELYTRAYQVDPVRTQEGFVESLISYGSELIEQRNFEQAVEVYTQAYQVDPVGSKDRFVRFLIRYGLELMEQGKVPLAKEQFRRVLEIQPDYAPAKEQLQEFRKHDRSKPNKRWQLLLGSIAAVVAIPILVGVGYYLGSNSCPAGQKRVDGNCVVRRFSDVKNVLRGGFKYAGSTIFAVIDCQGKGINSKIQSDQKGFNLIPIKPEKGIAPDSGTGIKMLVEGHVHFALSSRPLETEEKARAKSQRLTLEEIPVARDVLAIIVNSSLLKQVRRLTIQDLFNIHTSKIQNWQDIEAKGPNLAITPYVHKAEIKSSLYSFPKEVLGGSENFGSTVMNVPDTTTGLRRVGAKTGAIYHAPASLVYGQDTVGVEPIPIGKNLDDSTLPFGKDFKPLESCGNVNSNVTLPPPLKAGYPEELQREKIYVIVKKDNSIQERAGRAYANLLLTDEGQRLMEQIGFQPIR